uniref:Uncharacterized protein n=1 Tax=Anguilla anguilla TaxID=7936 RepID=A0A0E9X4Z1_ANGAN
MSRILIGWHLLGVLKIACKFCLVSVSTYGAFASSAPSALAPCRVRDLLSEATNRPQT